MEPRLLRHKRSQVRNRFSEDRGDRGYFGDMAPVRSPISAQSTTVIVKLGRWFEASATGWGVLVVPLLLVLVLAAALLHQAMA
jgi:hypothetical protein